MSMENEKQSRLVRNATYLFVFVIVLFSVVCLTLLNMKYDSLSRYPYRDQKSRDLIKQYLTQEEIDYIIEYSIAPNVFIAFIRENGFNIYNAAEYKRLSTYQWDRTPAEIVRMIEETRDVMDTDTLIILLSQYSYEEIKDYLDNGDPYKQDSVLVLNAAGIDAWVDQSHTVVRRKPPRLQKVSDEIPADAEILLEEEARGPLEKMCQAIQTRLNSEQPCAGLILTGGYVSYDEQKKRYEDAAAIHGREVLAYEQYPGHCERQLGLSVDFRIEGISDEDFDKTLQNLWLEENAWEYGFVCTWDRISAGITGIKAQPWHYRYIGEELARQLHMNRMTFAEYIASVQ